MRYVIVSGLLAMVLLASTLVAWTLRRGEDRDSRKGSLEMATYAYERFIETTMSANKLTGRDFPRVRVRTIEGDTVDTDLRNKAGGIFLLFEAASCQPCLATQLKALKYVLSSLQSKTDIVVAGFSASPADEVKRYVRTFRLPFPIVADMAQPVFGAGLGEMTPVVVLVNEYNVVVDAHIPSPGRPEFSVLFYNELPETLKHKLGIGMGSLGFDLTGVSYVSVIRNEFAKNDKVQDLLF